MNSPQDQYDNRFKTGYRLSGGEGRSAPSGRGGVRALDWTLSVRYDVLIGIGGNLTAPPLPHHRTCGSASGGSRSYAVALAGLSVSWAVNCDSVSSLPVPQASPARMEEKSSSVWIFRCLSLLRSMSYLPLLSFGPSVTVSGLAYLLTPPFGIGVPH
jgi:hypothetical protein